MTIGIATTPYGNNFGEVMQAYALKTTLEKMFPDTQARILNYTPESRDFRIKPGFELYSDLEKEKNGRFIEFRKQYLDLDDNPVHYLNRENAPEYDAYFFGSDQIWNTAELAHPEFFGSFVPEGKKKVAYAASVGAKEETLPTELFEKYIDKFDYLSVREKQHVSFVEKFTSKEVKHVCDPTLLFERADYESLLKNVEIDIPSRPYIFFYHPHATDGAMLSFVNRVARMYSLDVVHSFVDIPEKMFPYGSKSIRFVGPLEFLKYLSEAELVVTRSYHASCLSIMLNKAFYTFADRKTGSRVESLCEVLGANEHLVHNYTRIESVDLQPDYTEINRKLVEFRESSKDFIKKALM